MLVLPELPGIGLLRRHWPVPVSSRRQECLSLSYGCHVDPLVWMVRSPRTLPALPCCNAAWRLNKGLYGDIDVKVRVQWQRSSGFVGRDDGYALIRGELTI